MKKTILIFALPLLLALSPTAASAARILWVNVETYAQIEESGEGVMKTTAIDTFTASVNGSLVGINAAKVSVSGEGVQPSPSYLLFAYEDGGRMVVNDPNSNTMPLTEVQNNSVVFTGMSWAPVYLSDALNGIDDEKITVTLELGYVDWDDYDADYAAYENNANTGTPVSIDDYFTKLAISAPTSLSVLADPNGSDGNHVSTVASLNPAGHTPWSPTRFTAVPEPATCGMALLGILLLARRRKPNRAVVA